MSKHLSDGALGEHSGALGERPELRRARTVFALQQLTQLLVDDHVEAHRLGCDLLRVEQCVDGRCIHAPHGVAPGEVDQDRRAAATYTSGQARRVEALAEPDRLVRVAHLDRQGDGVDADVGRAEGEPEVIALVAEPLGGPLRFVEELVGGSPVAATGGTESAVRCSAPQRASRSGSASRLGASAAVASMVRAVASRLRPARRKAWPMW